MNPQDVHRLLLQAAGHEDAGRPTQAIALYRQVLAQEPARANTWFNLARQLRAVSEPLAALAAYDRALTLGIDAPEEVHLNRGVIFSDDLRDADQAERAWSAALEKNPRYAPAWMNLANLHEDRGAREQALQSYARVLELTPNDHEALARCASLQGISGPDDPRLQHLRRAAASARSTPAQKASLSFAIGKLLDEVGAYDQAFDAYRQANHCSRLAAPAHARPYDRAMHERFIDRLIQAFPPPQRADVQTSGPAPVFICGMFRSGSTLAEQVLAAHPQVKAGGELAFIPQLVATQLNPYPEAVSAVSTAAWASLAARYRRYLDVVGQGATLVTDKRPDNFLHIGLIKALFPNARIVHTTRHAIDNALSIYFLHLDPAMAYATSLEDIAHQYVQYRRLMAHWQAHHGQDILTFPYEDFVRQPRLAAQKLLAFCGLPWDEGCMNFHALQNMVRTASAWQVRRPVFTTSAGRWKNYEKHLAPLLAALGEFAT